MGDSKAGGTEEDEMGKHAIAVVIEGERINEQVREEQKAEFYASDVWDHEFCGDGDPCSVDGCPYVD